MKSLSIDIETYSSVDLSKSGVFKYVESPDFDVLLFAYKVNNDPVKVVDLASGEKIPEEILLDLSDPTVLKTAFNASFEITCLKRWFETQNSKVTIDPRQWEDTMLRASYSGYTGSLKSVAETLDLKEEEQKDKRGTLLINLFSKPRKPSKKNPNTRVLPEDEPEKWEQFKEYNRRDVEVEFAIRNALIDVVIPEKEKAGWLLDFKIQERGVRVDMRLVESALNLDKAEKARLTHELQLLTGISNPKSGPQIKEWLNRKLDREISTLTKDSVPELIKECEEEGQDEVATALELRQELTKTSLAKYSRIKEMVCQDNKVHGILKFYGSRTGRWAGRGVQIQNLPRNYLISIGSARELFLDGNYEGLKLVYGFNLSDIASQLIRTSFVPDDGKMFAVADYSAIEARVIAWLSGEEWRLNVFRTTGKIYEESAAQLFNVPFEKICDKSAPEHKYRAQGKVAELALGYQGGPAAIEKFDPDGNIPKANRASIVERWREKSPHIVKLWWDCNNAALDAIDNPGQIFKVNGLAFKYDTKSLSVTLPSGRNIYYPNAKIGTDSYGRRVFEYTGMIQATRKIGQVYMYGGKIVENVIQSIARDCLAEALLKLDKAGYDIKFHVHDEVIIEVNKETAEEDLKKIIGIMCEPPEWAPDLPLNAEGFVSEFYMKD